MKALIDTCVIVDILQKREPFYQAAMEILLSVSNRKCTGFLTAKSITDIYYILRRSIHNEEEVRRLVHILFTLLEVKDTFSADCELALDSPMTDYEDAIMVQTACRIVADCIVTRNLKDYKLSSLPVFSPEQFLSELGKEENHQKLEMQSPLLQLLHKQRPNRIEHRDDHKRPHPRRSPSTYSRFPGLPAPETEA